MGILLCDRFGEGSKIAPLKLDMRILLRDLFVEGSKIASLKLDKKAAQLAALGEAASLELQT